MAVARRKMSSEPIPVRKGSANVFADLHLPEPNEAKAKAQLAAMIGSVVRRRGLSQAEAARLLGVDQPKVSALMNGRLTGFSTGRLFRFLNALGLVVEISVKPAKPASRRVAIEGIRVLSREKRTA
jgi:predicted XRE-type DNA-binding protein